MLMVIGPELVDYINFVIGCCNSLIAVVSHKTVSSWWVPLEIGIAITKGLRLGTFLVLTSRIHETGFPVLSVEMACFDKHDKLRKLVQRTSDNNYDEAIL